LEALLHDPNTKQKQERSAAATRWSSSATKCNLSAFAHITLFVYREFTIRRSKTKVFLNMASKAKKETGLSVATKKKEDLGMWYQEVLTVSCHYLPTDLADCERALGGLA
jgi:hypothetical protein